MKVKLVWMSFGEAAVDVDLTIGKIYEATLTLKSGTVQIVDDVGDVNHLFKGEYEVVDEA